MEVKNNKGIVTLLIVIIILLVCAVGFLSYKLYFAEDQNNPGNTNNTNNPNNPNNNNQEPTDNTNNDGNDKNDVEDNTIKKMTFNDVLKVFESGSDSKVVRLNPNLTNKELETNFENKDKSNNNYNIVVSCTNYDDSEKTCDSYSVKVNSTIEYWVFLDEFTDLFSYNDYLVLVQTRKNDGLIEIKIFDKDNNEIYKNSKSYSKIFEDEGSWEYNVAPKIVNNTLYFVEGTDGNNNMSLVSIDLSKSTIKAKTIGEFVAHHYNVSEKE